VGYDKGGGVIEDGSSLHVRKLVDVPSIPGRSFKNLSEGAQKVGWWSLPAYDHTAGG
jgi:hypothetical protein